MVVLFSILIFNHLFVPSLLPGVVSITCLWPLTAAFLVVGLLVERVVAGVVEQLLDHLLLNLNVLFLERFHVILELQFRISVSLIKCPQFVLKSNHKFLQFWLFRHSLTH